MGTSYPIVWPERSPAEWRRERFYFTDFLRSRQVITRSAIEETIWRTHVARVKASLKKHGQRDPIFVKEYDDHIRVHPGVSRMTAAQELGWTWLWAEVSDRRT